MKARSFPLLALALLAACGDGADARRTAGGGAADGPEVPEAQRFGGTGVVALGADITDMNPLTSADNNANNIQSFVLFTPVVALNEKLEPVPALARSWELNADSTELTFHLRNDIRWQDGRKTTAYDLKLAYDLAREKETGYPNSSFWTYYGDAAAPDSFTFRVRLRPHAEYMDPWRTFFAVPSHIFKDAKPAELRSHPFNTQRPVGNGPFRFVSRAPGQNWVFAANPDYPAELGGRPYLDRLIVRVIPEAATRLTELLNGTVDYYVQVTPEQLPQLEASRNARLVTFRNRSYAMVVWNQKREMFQDARVRRALTMAINKRGIIDGILRGHGEVAHSSIPNIYWMADSTAGRGIADYDPARAAALLDSAGWTDRNRDGVRENAQGKPFRFTLKTNTGNRERADLTEVIQSDLAKVGVDARIQIVEFGTLISQLNNVRERPFEAVVMGWVSEFKIDDENLFSCRRLDEPYQWPQYCNPRTTALLDTLPRIVDREQARPLWREYQRLIAQDQPYTFLYFQERLEGVSNRMRNVHPDARGDLVGISKWYLLPNGRARQGGGG
ncbi:MAG TPA: ABC transporter substrate-binding protein [Longimicrobium sp.]|jgi:peptide/nickel transport system substrate-binding protein|uniref:ABC transporter substrate-binding protein n=1 Tax=Longimicrobium sp. TaxID=2029185 RepID=UPI002ED7AAE9